MEALLLTLRGIKGIIEKSWLLLAVMFPWAAPIAALFALLTAWDANYSALVSGVNSLSAYFHGQPYTAWLGQANRFFPISEALTMCLHLLLLRVVAMVIRSLKSFIPTIN